MQLPIYGTLMISYEHVVSLATLREQQKEVVPPRTGNRYRWQSSSVLWTLYQEDVLV